MRLLIAYATTDGQTRKIARFAADHLSDLGHSVELLNAADTEGLDLARFGAVIVSGSLHEGGFQSALTQFATDNAAALDAKPTVFLPVSLSAAGDDPDDLKGLNDCVTRFLTETGWHPTHIQHVAGAFRFTEYGFFRSWAMRRIAAAKGEAVDPHHDKEYTDWPALKSTLTEWQASLSR